MGEYLIKRSDSEAMVSILGGTVTSFKVKSKEIFYPWRSIDDKERGGCFMCAPWFGLSSREPKKHGYLREEYACGSAVASNKVEFFFTPVGHENYPWVLEYLTSAAIWDDGSLHMTLSITRAKDGVKGKSPILPGFHPFFICQDVNDVRVRVRGKEFHGFSENAMSFPLKLGIINIEMPERNLQMEFSGDFSWSKVPRLVFWTGSPKEYACVEPIVQGKQFFESPKGYYLGEGESMELSVLFRVLKKRPTL